MKVKTLLAKFLFIFLFLGSKFCFASQDSRSNDKSSSSQYEKANNFKLDQSLNNLSSKESLTSNNEMPNQIAYENIKRRILEIGSSTLDIANILEENNPVAYNFVEISVELDLIYSTSNAINKLFYDIAVPIGLFLLIIPIILIKRQRVDNYANVFSTKGKKVYNLYEISRKVDGLGCLGWAIIFLIRFGMNSQNLDILLLIYIQPFIFSFLQAMKDIISYSPLEIFFHSLFYQKRNFGKSFTFGIHYLCWNISVILLSSLATFFVNQEQNPFIQEILSNLWYMLLFKIVQSPIMNRIESILFNYAIPILLSKKSLMHYVIHFSEGETVEYFLTLDELNKKLRRDIAILSVKVPCELVPTLLENEIVFNLAEEITVLNSEIKLNPNLVVFQSREGIEFCKKKLIEEATPESQNLCILIPDDGNLKNCSVLDLTSHTIKKLSINPEYQLVYDKFLHRLEYLRLDPSKGYARIRMQGIEYTENGKKIREIGTSVLLDASSADMILENVGKMSRWAFKKEKNSNLDTFVTLHAKSEFLKNLEVSEKKNILKKIFFCYKFDCCRALLKKITCCKKPNCCKKKAISKDTMYRLNSRVLGKKSDSKGNLDNSREELVSSPEILGNFKKKDKQAKIEKLLGTMLFFRNFEFFKTQETIKTD